MKTHETQITVKYQETDNMGVVYYANYFIWFEVARTEYLKSHGISYKKLEDGGFYLVVASATCQYKSPARYDDVVRIQTWIPELKNSSLKFAHKLYVGERLVATGESMHVFTDKNWKPVRMPEEIRDLSTSN